MSLSAQGATFNNGIENFIDAPVAETVVVRDATVTVQDGADIQPPGATNRRGVEMRDADARLNVTGGRVSGGDHDSFAFGGRGVEVFTAGGEVTVSGGLVKGGTGTTNSGEGIVNFRGGRIEVTGGEVRSGDASEGPRTAIIAGGTTVVDLSGGVVKGGNSTDPTRRLNGGTGLNLQNDAVATISGDVLVSGGDGTSGTGVSMFGARLDVTGGRIAGGSGEFGAGNGLTASQGLTTISGGLIEGGSATSGRSGVGLSVGSAAEVIMTGGTVKSNPGGNLGQAASVSGKFTLDGGSLQGQTGFPALNVNAGAIVNILSGSVFGGGPDTFNRDQTTINALGGILNISGGRIFGSDFALLIRDAEVEISGGSIEGRISVGTNGSLDVLGSNLSIENRRLTGTLLSGDLIDVAVSAGSGAAINLIETAVVPLPPALALYLSLLVVGGIGLRRARRAQA